MRTSSTLAFSIWSASLARASSTKRVASASFAASLLFASISPLVGDADERDEKMLCHFYYSTMDSEIENQEKKIVPCVTVVSLELPPEAASSYRNRMTAFPDILNLRS